MNNNYMTITEVTERIGVASKTIIRWEKAGKIRKSKRDYRGWRMYSQENMRSMEKMVNTVY